MCLRKLATEGWSKKSVRDRDGLGVRRTTEEAREKPQGAHDCFLSMVFLLTPNFSLFTAWGNTAGGFF